MLTYFLCTEVLLNILSLKSETVIDFFFKILLIIAVIFIGLITLIIDFGLTQLEIIVGIIYLIKGR